MKKFIGWFRSFFDEDDGASTTRALTWIWTFTLCGILWLLVITRVIYALKYKDITLLVFPTIDSGIIMLTTAFLTAKVIQKGWGEKDSGNSTTTLTLPSGSFSTSYASQPVFAPVAPVTQSIYINQVSGSLPTT